MLQLHLIFSQVEHLTASGRPRLGRTEGAVAVCVLSAGTLDRGRTHDGCIRICGDAYGTSGYTDALARRGHY